MSYWHAIYKFFNLFHIVMLFFLQRLFFSQSELCFFVHVYFFKERFEEKQKTLLEKREGFLKLTTLLYSAKHLSSSTIRK